jgi:hypothetical protein
MARTAPKTRTQVKTHLFPEGEDDGLLPRLFRVEVHTTPQQYSGRSRLWLDSEPTHRQVVAEHQTRDDIVEMIREWAEWLAYDGSLG